MPEPAGARPSRIAAAAWAAAPTWGLLLFAGVFWGLGFSLAKIATTAGAAPINITFWQTLFGIAMLGSFVAVRRRRLPLDPQHLRFYCVCGLAGTVVPSLLLFYSAIHLPAGVLSIAISTVPLLTVAFALGLRVETFSVARLAGILLGIVAVAMIVAPEAGLPERSQAVWVMACVAAAACYAVENVYIALRRPMGSDPAVLLLGMTAFSMVVLLPLGVATGHFGMLSWPPGPIEFAILAMAAINVVCYGGFVFLVTLAGPVFASQIAYVVTLAGVMWGIAIFAEVHSGWVWAALAVMMVGLTLVKPREAQGG